MQRRSQSTSRSTCSNRTQLSSPQIQPSFHTMPPVNYPPSTRQIELETGALSNSISEMPHPLIQKAFAAQVLCVGHCPGTRHTAGGQPCLQRYSCLLLSLPMLLPRSLASSSDRPSYTQSSPSRPSSTLPSNITFLKCKYQLTSESRAEGKIKHSPT